MKKKLLVLMMLVLLTFALIPSVIAACSHTCTWQITKSSTCTETGSKSYKCTKCKTVTKTATTPAKGHKPSTASCINAGKCSRCGVITSNALGHNYTAATCITASTCTRCGAAAGPALGHTWSIATCTTAKKCTRCKKIDGKPLGHRLSGEKPVENRIVSYCSACKKDIFIRNMTSADKLKYNCEPFEQLFVTHMMETEDLTLDQGILLVDILREDKNVYTCEARIAEELQIEGAGLYATIYSIYKMDPNLFGDAWMDFMDPEINDDPKDPFKDFIDY